MPVGVLFPFVPMTQPNHYIIAKSTTKDGFKLVFGKVESVSRGIMSGYHEKNSHINSLKTSFEIPVKDVVLDAGLKPHPGSAYGFDLVNLFTVRKAHSFFGTVNFMYRPEKDAAVKLFSAFDQAEKILTKCGLYFPAGVSTWEIQSKEAKGKWAGSFRASNKPDTHPHRFAIKPESLPNSEYVYVILHEFAHYLHHSALKSPKLNAAWIKAFNTSIKLQTVKKEVAVNLLEMLVSGEERPSDFKSGLDEEQRNAFNWIIRTIKSDHSVSIKELDTLFEADAKDEIRSLWPQRTLHKKDLQPVVSEYATTNYHELLAESFAFYWTKRKLPANITKLVEKSLSVAKASQDPSE